MIYFDNAATSYPKPLNVINAVTNAFYKYGANPGRSGHQMSLDTAKKIYECREEIAELFNVTDAENIVFTQNCTHSINLALKGSLNKGDHVIISNLEHNAVVRPLYKMAKQGIITYDIATVYPNDTERTVRSFKSKINSSTKMIFTTHGSNVFGIIVPIEELAELAKYNNLLFGVDAAQTAGVLDISCSKSKIDFLCAPGHKGLYGPTGTGIFICNANSPLETLMEGGTGSRSRDLEQPTFMPDMFESGTINTSGIIGLCEGVKFIKKVGIQKIHKKECNITNFIYKELVKNKNIILYTDNVNSLPIISFNIVNKTGEETAALLNQYKVAVRGGLHCSRLAHESFNTLDFGTARISPGYFNTSQQVEEFIQIIRKITK